MNEPLTWHIMCRVCLITWVQLIQSYTPSQTQRHHGNRFLGLSDLQLSARTLPSTVLCPVAAPHAVPLEPGARSLMVWELNQRRADYRSVAMHLRHKSLYTVNPLSCAHTFSCQYCAQWMHIVCYTCAPWSLNYKLHKNCYSLDFKLTFHSKCILWVLSTKPWRLENRLFVTC